jgi:hypothetical protein
MTSSGFDSQVGYAIESPSGTYTAPTRAIEHVKSALTSKRDPIISQGIKANRRHQGRSSKGIEVVGGSVLHELAPQNTGMLFTQLMGAVANSGAGPYTHVFTSGPLVETQSLTVQVGTPDDAGTINPLNFLGCQIASATITVPAQAKPVMIEPTFVGQHLQNTGDGDTPGTLVAATYAATYVPFTSLNAVLTLAGAEFEFDDLTINIDNGLKTGRYTARSTNPSRAKIAKESGWRTWSVNVNADLWNLVAMNRAFASTEVAFSLALTAGTASLTIAGNVRTDPFSPTVDGPDTLKQGLKMDFVSLTSDAAAMTMTLVNSDATP